MSHACDIKRVRTNRNDKLAGMLAEKIFVALLYRAATPPKLKRPILLACL
jgi:hypothetical protein